jgi:NAD(P)-dependent dehydrogenase (short-subunit alcohol dehydrogenase family)
MEPTGTAVVTGASRGIGRAVAVELARAGFDVVATMRNTADGSDLDREAADLRGSLVTQRLDVTDPTSITVPDELRVLVNNAAVDLAYEPVEESTLPHWRAMFDTNVLGTFEVTRQAIPSLRRAGGGVVCMVTSSSLLMPVPFYGAYRASKAAVSALGETLRSELAPFAIRVVEILPGPVDTDMLELSDRPPDLTVGSPYQKAAEHYTRLRRDTASDPVTSSAAARRIVTTILDDDAPLRNACDPMADAMLDTWRATRDEDLLREMVPVFLPDTGTL